VLLLPPQPPNDAASIDIAMTTRESSRMRASRCRFGAITAAYTAELSPVRGSPCDNSSRRDRRPLTLFARAAVGYCGGRNGPLSTNVALRARGLLCAGHRVGGDPGCVGSFACPGGLVVGWYRAPGRRLAGFVGMACRLAWRSCDLCSRCSRPAC
jgi:hypothetical protein